MLKRLLVGVSFLMLGAFGLQAQSSNTQPGSQQQYGTSQDQYGTQSSNPSQSGSQLSRTDQDFVKKAFRANEAEIQQAQIAEQKSTNNDVKQYARELQDDHTKANDQLKQIASRKGINLPSTSPSMNQNQFSNLSGPAFDRQFIQNQMRSHRQAIAMFQNEANSGQDPDLKSFASDQLNGLRQHEKMASDLRSKVASESSSARNSRRDSSSNSYAGSESNSQYGDQSANNSMPSDSSSGSQSSSSTSSSTTNNTTNNYQASNNPQENQKLPRTASNVPFIGLFGFMLIGAALVMRSFRLLRKNR